MGEYYSIICHTCRECFTPSSFKLREIALNIDAAMQVGHFCTLHPGHRLELRGDEYNYDASFGEAGVPAGYERVTLGDDQDIKRATDRLNELRAAEMNADTPQPAPPPPAPTEVRFTLADCQDDGRWWSLMRNGERVGVLFPKSQGRAAADAWVADLNADPRYNPAAPEQPPPPPVATPPARTLAEMPRVPEITEDLACCIYDVLCDECGARLDGRDDFVRHVLGRPLTGSQTEYRFQGALGSGGKFYCDSFGRWRVDCYPEDKTDTRSAWIADAMTRLRRLANIASRAGQQPAPVAADGAGQGERRWMVQFKGGLGVMCCLQPEDLPEASGGMPVPVLVTVLADDAAPAGAEGAGKREQIIAQLSDQVEAHGRLVRGELASLGQRLAAAESRALEAEALRAERDGLRGAVQQCLDAMEMQDNRQSGALEIPGETALCIWRDAQAAARAALGGGTPA